MYGHGLHNASYVFMASTWDFKWSWRSITYFVQARGSAQSSTGSFSFKNKYCSASVSP